MKDLIKFLDKDISQKSRKNSLSVLKNVNSTASSIKQTKKIKKIQETKKNNHRNKSQSKQENQLNYKQPLKNKSIKNQFSHFEIQLFSSKKALMQQCYLDNQKPQLFSEALPRNSHEKNQQFQNHQKMRKVLNLFHLLNGKIKQNSDKMFLQNNNKQKTKQALKGICNNLQKNISGLFNTWRRNIRSFHQDQKKIIYETVIYSQSSEQSAEIYPVIANNNLQKRAHMQQYREQLQFSKQITQIKEKTFDKISFISSFKNLSESIKKIEKIQHYLDKQDDINISKDKYKTQNLFKARKIYNILNKLYKIRILNSFIMIQLNEPQINIQQSFFLSGLTNSNFTLCSSQSSLFLSLKTTMNPAKGVACQMTSRIFNKHFNKQLKKWYFKTVPMKNKQSLLSPLNNKKTIQDFKEQLKIQKLNKVMNNLKLKHKRLLQNSFYEIKINLLNKQFQQRQQYYINQKLMSSNQTSLLIGQLEDERQSNYCLNQEIKEKNYNIEFLTKTITQLQYNQVVSKYQRKFQRREQK